MTSPVTFTPCPSGNRDIAMLGENEIGSVTLYKNLHPNIKAHWTSIYLSRRTMPCAATSLAHARKQLLLSASEHYKRCNRIELLPLAYDLRMQAEGEGSP